MPRDMLADADLLIEPALPAIKSAPPTPAQQFERAGTMHEILGLALDDFAATLDDPRYVIDFRVWHRPIGKESSAVCLAGAVMAKRLGVDIKKYCNPSVDDVADARNGLEALYCLSTGRIDDAARAMDLSEQKTVAAAQLAEHWMPILGFTRSAKLDQVDSYWLLACLTGLQADLAEVGL